MKYSKILLIIGIALLPLLYGCPEDKVVTTNINRDGSCVRTVGVFYQEVFEGIESERDEIPIPVDNSWEMINITDTTAILRKEFKSIAELNASYDKDTSAFNMHDRNVELVKRFRWFHTVFQYRETYNASITDIPITNYVNEQEAEVFKSDDSEEHPLLKHLDERAQNSLSDNIEERYGLWLHDNIYSMAFDDIMDVADSLGLIKVQNINLNEVKDTIKHMIDQGDKQLMTFEDDQLDPVDIAELICKEINLDSAATKALTHIVRTLKLDEVYENEILGGFGDEFHNNVIMPGVLIDTNAEKLNSDTLSWYVGPIKFIDNDYVMFAESRITNRWAYILSGIIVIVAIIIPFLKKKKA